MPLRKLLVLVVSVPRKNLSTEAGKGQEMVYGF